MSKGKLLSKERRTVARTLRDHIVSEIQNLQMKDANLEISFQLLDKPTIDGIEFVEFLISPNKGEPLKSLNKIASGGELSRIMLALKSIFVQSRDKLQFYLMRRFRSVRTSCSKMVEK